MTALQEGTHSFRAMEMQAPVDLTQVLASSARDLLKEEAEPSTVVTLRLGLMIALQEGTHSFQELETLELADLIQVLVLSAKDSLRRQARLVMMVISKTGLINAIHLRIL